MSKSAYTPPPRYHVCMFPSLLGTPWKTDRRWVAYLYVGLRVFAANFAQSPREIRLIDTYTNHHHSWIMGGII